MSSYFNGDLRKELGADLQRFTALIHFSRLHKYHRLSGACTSRTEYVTRRNMTLNKVEILNMTCQLLIEDVCVKR